MANAPKYTTGYIANVFLDYVMKFVPALGLFNRSYEAEFQGPMKKGSRVRIGVKTQSGQTRDWTAGNDIVVDDYDSDETFVEIEALKYRAFHITDWEFSLQEQDFRENVIMPEAQGFAEDLNAEINKKFNQIYNYYATSPATPADITTLAQAINAANIIEDADLDISGEEKFALLHNSHLKQMLNISNFIKADERGDNGEAFRMGQVGFGLGTSWIRTSDIALQGGSSRPSNWLVDSTTGLEKGSKRFNIDSGQNRPVVGDLFKLASDTQAYVVTKTFGSGSEGIIEFEPGLKVATANNRALTFVAQHEMGFIGTRRAGAMIMIPPMALTSAGSDMQRIEESGAGFRAEMWREPRKQSSYVKLDTLFGFKIVDPRRAGRICLAK